jgi:D-methionine transport system ATP-binding protein
MLYLKEVSFVESVSSRYLLQDISFDVSWGERLAIVGPSGAGKTSLLRLLNRLLEPTNGLIKFENQRLNQIPIIQLRQQIVLAPQEPKLLGMTVQEALAYPLVLQQLPKGEIADRVENWRSRLHIPEDWLERNELQLSLGQRQLVSLARALVMQPKILLIDEPTSALDAGSANHLIEVLIDLSNSNNTSIIMVNHHLEWTKKFAQRALYLHQGNLLENKPINQFNWDELRENLVKAEAEKIMNYEL